MESCWCKAPFKTCIVGCISTHPGEAMPNPWKELSIRGKRAGILIFFWSDCTQFSSIFIFNMSERKLRDSTSVKEKGLHGQLTHLSAQGAGKRCAYTWMKSSGVWQLSSKCNYDYMINRIIKAHKLIWGFFA